MRTALFAVLAAVTCLATAAAPEARAAGTVLPPADPPTTVPPPPPACVHRAYAAIATAVGEEANETQVSIQAGNRLVVRLPLQGDAQWVWPIQTGGLPIEPVVTLDVSPTKSYEVFTWDFPADPAAFAVGTYPISLTEFDSCGEAPTAAPAFHLTVNIVPPPAPVPL